MYIVHTLISIDRWKWPQWSQRYSPRETVVRINLFHFFFFILDSYIVGLYIYTHSCKTAFRLRIPPTDCSSRTRSGGVWPFSEFVWQIRMKTIFSFVPVGRKRNREVTFSYTLYVHHINSRRKYIYIVALF